MYPRLIWNSQKLPLGSSDSPSRMQGLCRHYRIKALLSFSMRSGIIRTWDLTIPADVINQVICYYPAILRFDFYKNPKIVTRVLPSDQRTLRDAVQETTEIHQQVSSSYIPSSVFCHRYSSRPPSYINLTCLSHGLKWIITPEFLPDSTFSKLIQQKRLHLPKSDLPILSLGAKT